MKIIEIIQFLEQLAPPSYQESYDNAGLITGDANWECSGIICTLDVTESVIAEAKSKGFNLVIAHHPIIFSGLKKITGKTYVEKTVIAAIKNDVAIYAIHTNLDNILTGVNGKIADKLGLINRRILMEKQNQLFKLVVFAPKNDAEKVRSAIFDAGAGQIGKYSECSFNQEGYGTFKAGEDTNPHVGEIGKLHIEEEVKIEIIFPVHLQQQVIKSMLEVHPYEEVAYDIIPLGNFFNNVGSGMIGELKEEMPAENLFALIKEQFNLKVIKHTPLLQKKVKKIALCGGAGSFLISKAKAANADVYITGDIKYHEFFDAEGKMIIVDIGHWESEQFTIDLLFDFLLSKFPTFAVQKSEVNTNPVQYFI